MKNLADFLLKFRGSLDRLRKISHASTQMPKNALLSLLARSLNWKQSECPLALCDPNASVTTNVGYSHMQEGEPHTYDKMELKKQTQKSRVLVH